MQDVLSPELRARVAAVKAKRDRPTRPQYGRPRRRRTVPTVRELQVLRLIADGLSHDQAAERLAVSVQTVKTHMRNIRQLLGARNSTHAVAIAFERGLLVADPRLAAAMRDAGEPV